MKGFFKFTGSSIGRKILMALTGLFLALFLTVHLVGNMTMFLGADFFNAYVGALGGVKPLVRVIEAVLALLFLVHAYNALMVTLENRKANSRAYEKNLACENSSLFSRNMGITGSLLGIFLLIHLSTMWAKFQCVHGPTDHGHPDFFGIVMSDIGFGSMAFTLMYFFGMLILAAHLKHRFESALQTFGWQTAKYAGIIKFFAVIFWLFIPLGFIIIPIYFGFLGGGH